MRYLVAIEGGISGLDVQQFADEVTGILADSRSWTGGGTWRLQRVRANEHHDFTIYLATPATRDRLCGGTYDRYTSCRNGDRVVINVARWAYGAQAYQGNVQEYRAYVVNHETGHRLGMVHVKCPGPGSPAPVMQQQTLGLHGCLPNPWYYLDGLPHTGPPGAYGDPIPAGP